MESLLIGIIIIAALALARPILDFVMTLIVEIGGAGYRGCLGLVAAFFVLGFIVHSCNACSGGRP